MQVTAKKDNLAPRSQEGGRLLTAVAEQALACNALLDQEQSWAFLFQISPVETSLVLALISTDHISGVMTVEQSKVNNSQLNSQPDFQAFQLFSIFQSLKF